MKTSPKSPSGPSLAPQKRPFPPTKCDFSAAPEPPVCRTFPGPSAPGLCPCRGRCQMFLWSYGSWGGVQRQPSSPRELPEPFQRDVLSAHRHRDPRAPSTSSPARGANSCSLPAPGPRSPKSGGFGHGDLQRSGGRNSQAAAKSFLFSLPSHDEVFWEHAAVNLCYCHYGSARCFSGENPKKKKGGNHSQRTFSGKT